MERHLFVYGTLRAPGRNPVAGALHRDSFFVGPATVRAKLYRVGCYPAMVMPRNCRGSVDGELYRLRDPEHQLALLDEYEGAAYRRTMVKATISKGRFIRSWSYIYRFRLRR